MKVNLFLPSPERPLLFPRTLPPAPLFSPPQPSPEDCKQLGSLLASDPLYEFDAQEASLVWRYRDYCKSVAGSLIKILACVPWTERLAAQDIYRQLDTWPALDPRDALGLLDRRLVHTRSLLVFCRLACRVMSISMITHFRWIHECAPTPSGVYVACRTTSSKTCYCR